MLAEGTGDEEAEDVVGQGQDAGNVQRDQGWLPGHMTCSHKGLALQRTQLHSCVWPCCSSPVVLPGFLTWFTLSQLKKHLVQLTGLQPGFKHILSDSRAREETPNQGSRYYTQPLPASFFACCSFIFGVEGCVVGQQILILQSPLHDASLGCTRCFD